MLLSTTSLFDIYFSIKFQIETNNHLIICLISLILFPVGLLIQSYFYFVELIENSSYEYKKINDKIEIINANQIFELDFRYLNDDEFNRGIFIMILSSILSYTKLIFIHIFINSYKNSTKFGFFQSLKFINLKINVLQIIFQTLPFFIRKLLSDISYITEKDIEISLEFFTNDFYYINILFYFTFFLIYFIIYKLCFLSFEMKMIDFNNECNSFNSDFDDSILSLNLQARGHISFITQNYTLNKNNNSSNKNLNTNESVEIRNSF